MTDAPLSTVTNAARLLKAFRSREATLGVSELARRLDLGKSAVHRLLVTLAAEGLIEQDPRSGGYRLGVVMIELGEAVKVHIDLHAAAGPVLAHLRDETGETCQVGVLDGLDVVYVDRLESAYSLRLFTETGRRVPAHCTSSGKVLLAHLPEAELQARTAGPFPRLTPHTIVDAAALRHELATVRARGWAEAVDEREIGIVSIAAPVRDRYGEVVAALSVGAPTARFGTTVRRRHAAALLEAGEAISRRLGWSPEQAEDGRGA
jgi:DNA-binding IclR family transcriptional regulator